MSLTNLISVISSGEVTPGDNVRDLFSIDTWIGNNPSSQAVVNNIDLATDGGMVWAKARGAPSGTSVGIVAVDNHSISDSETGAGQHLIANNSDGIGSGVYGKTFNTNGFIPEAGLNYAAVNTGTVDAEYVSWTFKKHRKFFDIQTWNGDDTNNRAIEHNLGTDVGMVLFKRTDSTGNWIVWHRSNTFAPGEGLALNQSSATSSTYGIGNGTTEPTATHFYVSNSLAVESLNATGGTYVAYLFAHNDGNGGFGPNRDQDIIKCASYTGNNDPDGPTVDVGFEPQLLIIKGIDQATDWTIFDSLRGIVDDIGSAGYDSRIEANNNAAENNVGTFISLRPNGFKCNTADTKVNALNKQYAYIAIRADFDTPAEREVPGEITLVFERTDADAGGNDLSVSVSGAQTGDYILAIQGANGGFNTAPANDIRNQMTMSTGSLTELTSAYYNDNEAANMKVWGGFYDGTNTLIWDGLSDTNAGVAVTVTVYRGVSAVTTPVVGGGTNQADIPWIAIEDITPGNWLVLGGVGAQDGNATYGDPGDGTYWLTAYNTSTTTDISVGMLTYSTLNTKMLGGKVTTLDRPNTWNISDDTGDSFARVSIQLQPNNVTRTIQEQVFAIDTRRSTEPNPPSYKSDFKVDFNISKVVNTTSNSDVGSRLLQARFQSTQNTNPTASRTANQYDFSGGYYDNTGSNSQEYGYMWKRAKGYFDIVHYVGNGSGNGDSQTISHNLGVVPEMAVWKSKSNGGRWVTYVNGIGTSHRLFLEDSATYQNENLGAPGLTETTFDALHYTNGVFPKYTTNSSGVTYAAYLFASLEGVSKVGTFSGISGDINVDCGFSNGPKFIILKTFASGVSGGWEVFDSVRGMGTVSDPYWRLESAASQVTGSDLIEPTNSGFIAKMGNFSPVGDYLFYAVAN